MNLARLNHILIPKTHDQRQKFRQSRAGRFFAPMGWVYSALSDEGRVLGVLMLFVGVAGLETEATQIYYLWSALAGMFVASVLARRVARLRDVELSVTAPPRVSVGEPTCFSVEIANNGDRDYGNVKVRGPFLPWDGTWLGPHPGIGHLPAGKTVSCESRATFIERGEHWLDPFEATAVAPLGIAVGPGTKSKSCRIMVVPRIAPVATVTLPTGNSYQPGGVAQASNTGEAMELFGVRPYRPGDSVRDLHIRTWARVGVPHVREYQQEYFTRVGVILDIDRAAASERGFEAAVSLAAGVVNSLSRGEALIDVLVVGNEVHQLTLGRSLGFIDQALDLLAAVQPGPSLGVDSLLANLAPYLSRLSAVILITQLGDPIRHELSERINGAGVPCRTLRVSNGRDQSEADGGHEQVVTYAEVEGEVGLRL